MTRLPRAIAGVLLAAFLGLAYVAWPGVGCSGCSALKPSVALLPGDSGPCTTVVTSLLADGGVTTSFTPCNFTGK